MTVVSPAESYLLGTISSIPELISPAEAYILVESELPQLTSPAEAYILIEYELPQLISPAEAYSLCNVQLAGAGGGAGGYASAVVGLISLFPFLMAVIVISMLLSLFKDDKRKKQL